MSKNERVKHVQKCEKCSKNYICKYYLFTKNSPKTGNTADTRTVGHPRNDRGKSPVKIIARKKFLRKWSKEKFSCENNRTDALIVWKMQTFSVKEKGKRSRWIPNWGVGPMRAKNCPRNQQSSPDVGSFRSVGVIPGDPPVPSSGASRRPSLSAGRCSPGKRFGTFRGLASPEKGGFCYWGKIVCFPLSGIILLTGLKENIFVLIFFYRLNCFEGHT